MVESNSSDSTEGRMTDVFVKNIFKSYQWEPECLEIKPQSLDDLIINETATIGNGCEGAVFEAKLRDTDTFVADVEGLNGQEYNLAVKAVFNYYAESNASSILQNLHKEIVPLHTSEFDSGHLDDIINMNVPRLPPHPNIVDMYCVFVDDMLVTEEGQRKFSAAMPTYVNPETCFARNKTLHLVMKKCTTELSKYLSHDLSMETRCLLLMQLLEAVCHMTSHGVAHRDIKPDNVLISHTGSGGIPHLQICDFGCCLAEEDRSLEIPYFTSEVNIGGNLCLMPPEISCARPGKNSVLDFRKSDLWACGALAYQILGVSNPFYQNNGARLLKSQTYSEEELPPLPENVPHAIRKLVKSLLARDPAKRPSPAVAVLVVHLVIWNKFSVRPQRSYDHPLEKRREMEMIWDEMFYLVQKLGSGTATLKQNIVDISKFFCLSRLTYSDLMEAWTFFSSPSSDF